MLASGADGKWRRQLLTDPHWWLSTGTAGAELVVLRHGGSRLESNMALLIGQELERGDTEGRR